MHINRKACKPKNQPSKHKYTKSYIFLFEKAKNQPKNKIIILDRLSCNVPYNNYIVSTVNYVYYTRLKGMTQTTL